MYTCQDDPNKINCSMGVLKSLFLLSFSFSTVMLTAQMPAVPPERLQNSWNAYWIAVPGEPPHDYGVYHFRKLLSLSAKPASFIVHVSGDNRYKLFVNESLVSLGPARGD